MTPMTLADCAELTAMLSAAYPNATFTTQSPNVWHMVLAGYTRDQVFGVLPSVMKASPEFCPSAPAIAKAVDDAFAPKVDTQAAWDLVHKAIRYWGSSHAGKCREYVREHDPAHAEIILAAADAIGWARLGQAPISEHERMLPQFRDFLADASRRSDGAQVRELVAVASGDFRYELPDGDIDAWRDATKVPRPETDCP